MTATTLYATDRQDYYRELLAAGMSEDEARRHERANALQRFRNRERYARDTHWPDEQEQRRRWLRFLGVR